MSLLRLSLRQGQTATLFGRTPIVRDSTVCKLNDQVLAPLAQLYEPIERDIEIVRQVFDEELSSEFSFVERLCSRVRTYRGKMLRPAILLLTAKATGEVSDSHYTLAAVAEMVHMATLVHDDVLDEAGERRRQPTICATSGNVTAVLLGDYLISHAFHLCSSLNDQFASRRIGATTNTVCEGELHQNRLRGNTQLSESTYFDIIRRKTGALTAVSCELGAHFAGADPTVVEALSAYGMSAGVAFQIIDDVLDVVGDREVIGKSVGRDLSLGKLTLPTIHCLTHASAGTAQVLRDVVAGRQACDHAQLLAWLRETGSLDYAVTLANEFVASATGQLRLLRPSDARTSLEGMAHFIVHRTF